MNVSDIMTTAPETIRYNKSVHSAVEAMTQIGCHHLPVVTDEGHIVGIITDSDCRRALQISSISLAGHAPNDSARETPVRRYMSPAPIIIEPDMPVEEAARLMLTNHISCLPVMRSETLVGIITTSDILMAFIRLQKPATINS